jgi:type VI secretion system protein ImpC
MVESIQHVLSRVRPPRVQITYDVETGGAIERKELPFVVGILADLAAKSNKAQPALKDRKFVEIDRDNFDAVMASIQPRLAFRVQKTFGTSSSDISKVASSQEGTEEEASEGKEESGDFLAIELFFNGMDDFRPINVVRQISDLNDLYEKRLTLNDLTAKLDGNDTLEAQLLTILSDTSLRESLAQEATGDLNAAASGLDKVVADSQMFREKDEAFLISGRKMIAVFINQLESLGDLQITDVYAFIMQRIAFLDRELSRQLDEVLHHTDFQKLEGSWRGLNYLVMHTETSTSLKLRLLQISWKELGNSLQNAVEFDQSLLFKKIYEEEYGTFGGNPYSTLVLDFPIGRNPKDLDILMRFSGVAAAAHAPALAQADPTLFDMHSFSEIGAPRDLAKIFDSSETVKWNSFRDSPDSRYISLLLPRILMRSPYGKETWPIDEFDYEESVDGETNQKFCWGNPAYAMAERITHAFSLYQWTAAIRGVEGGGLIENLPTYTFKTIRGDSELKCPTEVVITDRRERELSDLGFIALCHCKGTDYAAFFGGQTTQKSKKYNTDEANANALISTRLPYMLNASRFAHYIKVMMRDKIGSFMSRADIEMYLQNWLADYVYLSDTGSQEVKARYPLREGRVYVRDVPGKPGSYRAVIFLRPHFQLEDLTVSLRLVANLPQPAGA